jgi:TRAP-type mannitol/chloroaromatic compound transport system substrate-binding protein
MKRREFLSRAGLGALAAGGLLTGCQKKEQEAQKAAAGAVAPTAEAPQEWTLLSAWPDDFPLLGESAHTLGKLITELSGGRVQVQVAQTQNPADVFDQVAAGKAQLGYGMGSLWHEKDPAFELFSSIPFGLAPREINGWLYEGNGLSLWQQAYKKYGIVPYPAGNTGLQMAGWFRKPLKKAGDLKGLRIRIDGLGA